MRKRIHYIILLLCLAFTACFFACKKADDSSPSNAPTVESVKSITLDKDSATLTVLETVTLSAQTQGITENLVWSSSDTTIAKVTAGVVEGYKAGSVSITASAEGVSASAQITFVAVDTTKLTLVCENINLIVPEGDSEQLRPCVLLGDTLLGGASFSYESANSSIASVSASGALTGVACGETTVTVSGSIKGYTLAPVSFAVTVSENVKLSTGVDGDRVTIYLTQGKNNDHETQYTLAPIVKVKNEGVENAVFQYQNSNSEVATLNGQVLTARSVGVTEVKISYTSAKGTTVEKTLSVMVLKPTTAILQDSEVLLGGKTANDLSVFGIQDEINKMIIDGTKTTLKVTGQKFTFNENIVAGLGLDVAIETDKEIYTLTADIYDYLVGTKADLTAFGKYTVNHPWASVALTANINYEMGNFFTDSGFKAGLNYCGLFDGRGYTIYNIKGNNGLFYGLKNATIKNVAFLNVVRDTYNGGGALVHEMYPGANNVIENVYMQVKFTAYDGDYLGGFVGIGDGTYRNVIVNTEFISKPFAYNAWCASYTKKPSMENCYAISSTSNGFMYQGETDGLYQDVASFNERVDDIKETFDEQYWKVVNGTLIFKSMESFVNDIYPMQSALSITNAQTQFDGQALKITTDITEHVKFSLKDKYDGLELQKDTLIALDSFVSGNITVVATWQHPIYGTVVSTEKTFTVIGMQVVTTPNSTFFAKNRNANFTLDLSAYAPTDIQAVEFNGETLDYQFGGSVLTVATSEFTAVNAELSVFVISNNGRYILRMPMQIVDYAIGTVAELKAFGIGLKSNPNAVAVLTDNIDYNGGNFSADSGFNSTHFFSGSLDGNGYTVYNIQIANGIFYGLKNATIKNIAFFNVTREVGKGGGSLANEMLGANLVENVYINVVFTGYTGAYMAGLASICEGTFKNVILVADFQSNPGVYNAWGRSYNAGKEPKLENCYAISTNSSGYMYDKVTKGLYKTTEAFNKTVNGIKGDFDEGYWKVVNGTLIFNSMESILENMYSDELSITNTQTQFDGRAMPITTNIEQGVVLSLKEEYAGILLQNGSLVTVGDFVSGSITVVATWKHPIYWTEVSTEKTFTVVATEIVEEKTTRLVAKNRSSNFTVDLSAYAPTAIQAVEFNGVAVGYQFNGNTLTIATSELTAVTAGLTVFVSSSNAGYIVKIPVEVVDYAIGTVAELKAFGTGLKSNLNAVAILTDNINYNSGNFYNDSGFNYTHMFSGSLDGKGYTISNMKATNGIFYGLKNATIKNIAFKNLARDTYNGGGSLANEMLDSNLVENVYIDVKFTAYAGDYLAGVASICEGTFRNVIVVADFQSRAGAYNAWGRSYNTGKAPKLENCYAVSTNSSGYMYDKVTDGLFTSMSAFESASQSLMQSFNAEYWEVANGRLSFKAKTAV